MDGARPVAQPPRHHPHRPPVVDRGPAADADEQPRPRGGRAPRRPRRLRRHRPGRARLEVVRRDGAHPHHAQGRRDDARAERPAGRRHADPRVGAARAHRQLQPGRRLGDLARVPPARAPRPDDVRPDDGRLVDLHRHPGHRPGHLRDLRRGGREALRRHPRRHAHPHRRLRRDGRRPAARRHDERGRLPDRRRRPRPPAPPGRAPLPRRGGRRPRPRRRDRAQGQGRAPRLVGRRGRQRRRGVPRAAPPRGADRHRHRPDQRPRPAVVPARGHLASRTGPSTPRRSPRSSPTGPAPRWPSTCRRWSTSWMPVPRSSTTATRSATRPARAAASAPSTSPGFVPAYIRPLFCEGKGPFRWAALSGDPKDIAATDRAVLDLFPDNEKLHKWIRGAQERIAFQGLPARICWLGQGERDKAGLAFNDLVRSGEVAGADRHRPRPPRHRVGRQPVPRDRVDARRLRRHRRLAAAQRPGQHRRPAPAGSRSTTAAGSASAARCTPARSRSPTAPTSRPRSSSGCSPTTRRWASSGTSTPATTSPSAPRRSRASASRCARADPPVMHPTWKPCRTATLRWVIRNKSRSRRGRRAPRG